MKKQEKTLHILFDGTVLDRDEFLQSSRVQVIDFIEEQMTLDALLNEIAKNIFDHAGGKGSIFIERTGSQYTFCIKDDGTEPVNLADCAKNWSSINPGTNFGIGLNLIKLFAEDLGIALKIDTSKGVSYSGTYTKKN